MINAIVKLDSMLGFPAAGVALAAPFGADRGIVAPTFWRLLG